MGEKKLKISEQCLLLKDLVLTVHFVLKELNVGHLCGIMLELGLNITERKRIFLYESNGIT
jgi:hypothetical protein